MKKAWIIVFAGMLCLACEQRNPDLMPDLMTDTVKFDTDDPAIWKNAEHPDRSVVFGTDKETDGAVYAFDLNGQVLEQMTIRGLKRPNNVDVSTGFRLSDSTTTDILVFTEREAKKVRVYSVPEMKPLDNGGFPVFSEASQPGHDLPMGVAVYKAPDTGETYIIAGRKSGPLQGYLHQYLLKSDSLGVHAELVRVFGDFSGKKEIEAIAVDHELGYVYYADEGHCIRKYYADPEKGTEELACFGQGYFKEDIEGIAVMRQENGEGMLIVSDQQAGKFNFFDRKTNAFLGALDLGTTETDGCEVFSGSLGDTYPEGLFVAMSNDKRFYFYNLQDIVNKMQ